MTISQTLERIDPRADFGLKIDFIKDTRDPGRVFRAFSGLIKFCESTDTTLLRSIDINVKPILLLEDIQEGSIIIWLKTFLESIDDDAIKDLELKKIIGSYLVKAKYVIIDFIEKRTTITSSSEIIELQAELVETARETQTSPLGIYSPPSVIELLENIQEIQSAVSELQPEDKVYYLSPSSSVPINLSFNVSPESIDDLITKETIISQSEMIWKVKKPDLLGSSKWQFIYNKRSIDVKVIDEEWLKRFRKKEFYLGPGDAIKAIVQTETKYDVNYEVISIQYTIEKVIDIIQVNLPDQLTIFEESVEEE